MTYSTAALQGLEEWGELPGHFNGKLFYRLVDYVMVYSDGRVAFSLFNGVKVGTEI